MENFWTNDEVYHFVCQYDILRGYDKEFDLKSQINFYKTKGSLIGCHLIQQSKENTKKLTVEEIEKILCEYYHLTKDGLYSILKFRNIFQYFLKKYSGLTCENIGIMFGKDHSTISANTNRIERIRQVDPGFRNSIIEISEKLKSCKQ